MTPALNNTNLSPEGAFSGGLWLPSKCLPRQRQPFCSIRPTYRHFQIKGQEGCLHPGFHTSKQGGGQMGIREPSFQPCSSGPRPGLTSYSSESHQGQSKQLGSYRGEPEGEKTAWEGEYTAMIWRGREWSRSVALTSLRRSPFSTASRGPYLDCSLPPPFLERWAPEINAPTDTTET